jgi:hypothetical protein
MLIFTYNPIVIRHLSTGYFSSPSKLPLEDNMPVDVFLIALAVVCGIAAFWIIKKGKKSPGKRTTWIDETIGMDDD